MQKGGVEAPPVPSNRIMFDVIAYGGNSRSLEWYSEGAVPPTVTHACQK